MQNFDVLIIGGGPAGSTLAHKLSAAGLHIAVMDKMKFPRNKVCAGWVTPEVMSALNIDLDEYAQGRVLQEISGFKVSILGHKQVESHYPDGPISYAIRRIEFDHYLLQRCGAELITGEAAVMIEKNREDNDQNWIVNEQYSAKIIVGAGGHFCPVARFLNGAKQKERAVVAQQTEFEMTVEQLKNCRVNEAVPELFFSEDLTGYGWVVRKGKFLNIGLGREDKKQLSSHVKNFCDYLMAQGKIPQHMHERFNGHAYLLYPHATREMVGDKILLIGDAAGLAYAKSGEGIRPAVESAILAAEVLAACKNNYTNKNLLKYQGLMQQRFGQRQAVPEPAHPIPGVVKKIAARQLMKTHWFTKNIVIDKWFLQSKEALIKSG